MKFFTNSLIKIKHGYCILFKIVHICKVIGVYNVLTWNDRKELESYQINVNNTPLMKNNTPLNTPLMKTADVDEASMSK
jgi:hypothetical protein